MPGPRALFRAAATAEMGTWALLLTAMVLKYSGTTEALMPLAGGLHGFVFLCYALVAAAVGTDQRWGTARRAAAVALAVVPFATVPLERRLDRRGALGPQWRLAATAGRPAGTPRGPAERVLAWVLRHVLLAAVLAVAAVVLVFLALLAAGPPGEWLG
ncbi:DUF3817 domain-containing protein [Citricoccus sp. SGAir0253]|nr:DUF3817 domain-containing protein [Citricoccus sp. SGAir0253]QCU79292.1 DUF3817 domain-containing protein [Citricoccus sp. SGAir0253]